MRDGADHLMTVEYDTKRMTTCPIRAVEQYIAVGTALGWNMTQGYLFPRFSRRPNTGAPIRGKTPISAPDMAKALKVHVHNARERTAFTMHSFKSGWALTRDLAGEDLPTVMQRAFWKKLRTAWRYLRLMEVLTPGSVGNSTNGKGSMGEPSLGIQTRVWYTFQPLIVFHRNGSVSNGEGETMARQLWPLILPHTTLTRSIDVKILPYNARRGFHNATGGNGTRTEWSANRIRVEASAQGSQN